MVNFKDGLENVINTLAQIEGQSWAEKQADVDGYTVASLYIAWVKLGLVEPKYREECPDELVDPRMFSLLGDIEIYGDSGYTRYVVKNSGEVLCSRHHVPPDSKVAKFISLKMNWW